MNEDKLELVSETALIMIRNNNGGEGIIMGGGVIMNPTWSLFNSQH